MLFSLTVPRVSPIRSLAAWLFMPRLGAILACIVWLLAAATRADIIYSQPQSPTGGLMNSSWVPPDGTDADRYAWESFVLTGAAMITEIQWQGDGFGNGAGFDIIINTSMTLPDPVGVLARYLVPGNAGQTPAGIVNGTQRYNYHYVLPTPLQLAGGTGYVINIEGIGGWSASFGTGRNGSHVDFIVGLAMFLVGPGDLAFTLVGTPACVSPVITTQPSPAAACASGANSGVFSVVASGTSLGYRWQIEAAPPGSNIWTDLSDGIILGSASAASGCLTSSLTVSNADSAAARRFRCRVSNTCGAPTSNAASLTVCRANCDCSATAPVLTANDFQCFLNSFAAGQNYANCDGSTVAPLLTANDFQCFLNAFAAGCP